MAFVKPRPQFTDLVRQKIGRRSQREISMGAAVSQTTIGNIMIGKVPDEETIRRLAPVIGEPVNKLLILAGYLPENCELVSDDPPIIIELRTNEPLSEEAKRQVIDFVTAWKAQHFPSQ